MGHSAWNEAEIRSAIRAYFQLLDKQASGEEVNKAAIYRRLSAKHPSRSNKAFELKFQNISAILYEEKLPYTDGLLPRFNYQTLLRLLVLDHVKSAHTLRRRVRQSLRVAPSLASRPHE